MKLVVSAAAILWWFKGIAMLLAPTGYYAAAGVEATPLVAMIIRANGAALLGLGTINWLARWQDRRAMAMVLTGDLVVELAAVAVVVAAMPYLPQTAIVVDIGGHLVLALLFGAVLLRTKAWQNSPS